MTAQKTIADYLYRAMLFLGIFAVASSGGDNKYTFEIGGNLLIAFIIGIIMFTILKIIELLKPTVVKEVISK